jgi:hypothetical protein
MADETQKVETLADAASGSDNEQANQKDGPVATKEKRPKRTPCQEGDNCGGIVQMRQDLHEFWSAKAAGKEVEEPKRRVRCRGSHPKEQVPCFNTFRKGGCRTPGCVFNHSTTVKGEDLKVVWPKKPAQKSVESKTPAAGKEPKSSANPPSTVEEITVQVAGLDFTFRPPFPAPPGRQWALVLQPIPPE